MEQFLLLKEIRKRDGYTQWYEEPNLESNSIIFENFTNAVDEFRNELLKIKKSKVVDFSKNTCAPCRNYLNDNVLEQNLDNNQEIKDITALNEMIIGTISDSKYRIKDLYKIDINITDNADWLFAFIANKDIMIADYDDVSIRTNIHNVKGNKKIYYFTYQVKDEDNNIILEISLRLIPIGKHSVINDNPRNSLTFTYKTFGNYYSDFDGKKVSPIIWIELGKKDGKKFLISEKVLTHKQFDKFTNVWQKSELRKWLNNEFYNFCFTEEEKNKIVTNEEGDKVSLLSKEEYFEYFKSALEASAMFTKYAQNIAAYNYATRYIQQDYAFWWLKTIGEEQCLYHVCNDGYLNEYERNIYCDGVRPVIIIDEV